MAEKSKELDKLIEKTDELIELFTDIHKGIKDTNSRLIGTISVADEYDGQAPSGKLNYLKHLLDRLEIIAKNTKAEVKYMDEMF